MPALKNAKHEIFAQEIAAGKTADEAYVIAGYGENRGNASRLNANESIRNRVAELQAAASVSAEVTIESLIREAGDIQSLALKWGQFSAANSALISKAKLCGLWVEKTDNTNTNRDVDPSTVSDAEIAAVLKTGSGNGVAPKANGKGLAH